MSRRCAAAVAVCVAALVATPTARADGKFWPPAREKTPTVPGQRGLVAFRDGRETLVIESSAGGASSTLGWIVPLPAPPEHMEVIRPGLFESLAFALGPEIRHHRAGAVGFSLVCFVLVLILALRLVSKPRAYPTLKSWLIGVLLIAVGYAMCVPTLVASRMAGGAADVEGVDVLEGRRLGSYDVTVVRAKDAGVLDEWLTANGFAGLSPDETEAIAGYVARQWVFFAAKLASGGGETLTPHPISFRFPTKEAVYPLRLTGLAGGRTRFDLYVVADQQAVLGGLRTAFADRFSRESTGYMTTDPVSGQHVPTLVWRAEAYYHPTTGHPDLEEILWDGCVLTRFRGTLGPSQMKEDLVPGWKPLEPCRELFYSYTAAFRIAATVALLAATVGLIVVMVARRAGFVAGDMRRVGRGLLAAAAAGALVGVIVFLTLPKRRVLLIRNRLAMYPADVREELPPDAMALGYLLMDVAKKRPEGAPLRSAAEFRADLKDALEKYPTSYLNPFDGEQMRELASPGNYSIDADGKGNVTVRYYDVYARPVDVLWDLVRVEEGEKAPQ